MINCSIPQKCNVGMVVEGGLVRRLVTVESGFQTITQKRYMPVLVHDTSLGNLSFKPMYLSTRKIHSYRRAIKLWMGYVEEGKRASLFDVPAVTALGWLLDGEMGYLDDFLKRYKINEREQRGKEVRQVILLWLAELAF